MIASFKSLLAAASLALLTLTSTAALAQTQPASTPTTASKNRLQIILERGPWRVGTTGDFNPM